MGNSNYPHLRLQRFGGDVLGVRLEGNPKKPEPLYFRVYLPFGDVDITRTTDNEYWIHVRRNEAKDLVAMPKAIEGEFKDARLDLNDRHAGEEDIGDFRNPALYHLAVRLGPKEM